MSRLAYLENQLEVTRRELKNLRQQLTSLQHVHQKECDQIKGELENFRCSNCRNMQKSQVEDIANAKNNAIVFKQIGTVYTDFPEKRGTPRQAAVCSDAAAKLILNGEIFTNPAHSLSGLEEFSHMWILFHFHKVDATHTKAKISPPRLNGIRTGIFGTRSPHRPSPIGLTLVKINEIRESTIYFSGVDMIDGTPVIDIKPFIPHYDNPSMINTTKSTCLNESSSAQNEARALRDTEENCLVRDVSLEQLVSISSPTRNQLYYTQLGEREAPDGEEGEFPDLNIAVQASDSLASENSEDCVRVPSWIHESPVTTLEVFFNEQAEFQLTQLGTEGTMKKNLILNVLRQDPRSVYLRERWRNQPYIFKISDLHVYCKFNDTDHTVTVHQVVSPAEAESTN